jgi:hypothetical protein
MLLNLLIDLKGRGFEALTATTACDVAFSKFFVFSAHCCPTIATLPVFPMHSRSGIFLRDADD